MRLLNLIATLSFLLTAGYAFYSTSLYQNFFAWDVFVLFDGGWRVAHGQVPHRDFHSPISFSFLTPLGLAMANGVSGADSVRLVVLGWAALAASFTFPLARSLTNWLLALFASVEVFLTAGALRPLSWGGPEVVSIAMQYNRLGWALLVPFTLALISAAKNRDDQPTFAITSAIAVFCGAVLVGLKPNYGIAAAIGLSSLTGYLLFRRRSREILVVVLESIAIIVGLWVISGVTPFSYAQDMLTLSKATVQPVIWNDLGVCRSADKVPLTIAGACAFVTCLWLAFGAWQLRLAMAFAIVASIWCFFTPYICATNAQRGEIPLFGIIPILAWAFSQIPAVQSRLGTITRFFLQLFLLACLGWFSSRVSYLDLQSWRAAFSRGTPPRVPSYTIPNDRLSDLYFEARSGETYENGVAFMSRESLPEDPVPSAFTLASFIADGISLVQKVVPHPSQVHVFSLTWADFISYAAQTKPVPDSFLFWHEGRVSSPRNAPPAAQIFEDVQYVLWPTRAYLPLVTQYGPFIKQHFVVLSATSAWTILKRANLPE